MRISHKLILGFVGVALLVRVVGYVSIHTSQEALTQLSRSRVKVLNDEQCK